MRYENRQQLQGYLDTVTRQVLSLPAGVLALRGKYIEDLRKIKTDLQKANYDIAEFELDRITVELAQASSKRNS